MMNSRVAWVRGHNNGQTDLLDLVLELFNVKLVTLL